MNAIAHALAHATATAMQEKSDGAKRSEEKGRDLKGPDLTSPDLILRRASFRSGVAESKSKVAAGRQILDLGLKP